MTTLGCSLPGAAPAFFRKENRDVACPAESREEPDGPRKPCLFPVIPRCGLRATGASHWADAAGGHRHRGEARGEPAERAVLRLGDQPGPDPQLRCPEPHRPRSE